MAGWRKNMERRLLPPPSPNIEVNCHPYPHHELQAARAELIRQLNWQGSRLDPIKRKIGILPDNRRFVYACRAKVLQAGEYVESFTHAVRTNGPTALRGANVSFDAAEENASRACEPAHAVGEKRKEAETPDADVQESSSKKPKQETTSDVLADASVDDAQNTLPSKRGKFFKCDLCSFADVSSSEMSRHLEEVFHCTASEFEGEVEPRYRALELRSPMALSASSCEFGSLVPVCKMCSMRFDNIFSCLGHCVVSHKSQDFSYHVRTVAHSMSVVIDNSDSKPACSVCRVRCSSLDGLLEHGRESQHVLFQVPQNQADALFVCKTQSCGKIFSQTHQMTKHLLDHASAPKYIFVVAHLGSTTQLTLLEEAVDSQKRLDLETTLCSYLKLYFGKSSVKAKDCRYRVRNLGKYTELLQERREALCSQNTESS